MLLVPWQHNPSDLLCALDNSRHRLTEVLQKGYIIEGGHTKQDIPAESQYGISEDLRRLAPVANKLVHRTELEFKPRVYPLPNP